MKVFGNHIITKILNIVLPLIGLGLMVFYEYCDTSCLYLKGNLLGIDLKYAGILYMALLFASTFLTKKPFGNYIIMLRTFMIAVAVGAEIILIRFQIVNDAYCLFCLLFSACIFILFGINFKSMNKKLMVASILAGLIGFVLFFEGQVTPQYDLSFLRLLC